MLCKYNGLGPWAVQTGSLDSAVVVFAPGANTIKDEDWEKIKSHPEVVARLAGKVKGKELEIVVESVSKAVEAGAEAKDGAELSALNATEAKKLIAETHNTVELKKWLEVETRAGVISAIEKQLAVIEKDRVEAAEAAKAKQGAGQEPVIE